MAAPKLQDAGPSYIDELLTTTLVNMMPGIKDNIFSSNPVFTWLYKGKNKIRRKGGASLSHGVLYEINDTVQSYQRFDVIDTAPQDGMTRDQWDWAQYSGTISIDGFTERVANAGPAQIEDILTDKKYQLERSFALKFEQHLFAASPGSKDIRSLPKIILGSGTEGDINGTTNTWWASTVTSSGSFAAQGLSDLTTLWNTLSMKEPAGGPEMLISDQTSLEAYEATIIPAERITDTRMADLGIRNLKFKDTPWTWSPQATSGVIYALHSDAIEFVVNSDTDFLVKPFVEPANQDARTSKTLVACALITGNRRKLGKLTSVSA